MWSYTLLPIILNMSITASVVIVFVLLARIPLKKSPKIFSYVLWAVVLFRLICPFSFPSKLSLMGILRTPAVTDNSVPFVPSDIVHTEYPQVDLPIPGVSEVINESLPQGQEQLVADPLESLVAAATVLWLCGIAAMLIYSAISLLLLRRRLISAVPLCRAVQNSLVLSREMKAFSHESIYLADRIPTPFVIGIIRPKIYLPSTLKERELSYVILHEQTHIRRHDHIVKMIAFLALAMHWFNPLVWIAFLLCVKDMEMSCDERVLREMGDGIKADYSTSLLSLAAGRCLINGSPLAFGEGNIKGRIKNVMNFRKPAFWVLVVAVIAVAVVCFCLMTNPATANISNNDVVDLSDIEEMNIGAEMPYLLYGDENIVVIQGTFGLLVYDLKDSLITNRISYSKLSSLGISMLHAAVSQDGTKVYLGNDEITSTELVFTHQYDIKTNTIRNLSKQPGNVYKLEVIIPSPGYNEQYDKYFDFNYLIGQSIIDFGESFLYLRANTDWSMKTLQIVSCQYKDGTSEILSIFSFPELNTNGKGLDNGKVGQPLQPHTGQTSLEPIAPKLSPEQNTGADMAELDYASDDIVIFHGYFGLFVYDLNSNKIVRSLDLKPTGCNFTQGDDYCDVTVSADGRTVQLHPMSSENMYVYSVPDNTLEETTYKQMENRFTDFIDIVDVVGLEKAGLHSHSAVKFDTGEYGYLYASDWTLGTLSYVRGDEIHGLFDFNVSLSADKSSLPTNDIEQSISNAILRYYTRDNDFYGNGYDVAGEGHITFETEEREGQTYAYIWEKLSLLGFENGILTEVRGHMNPAAIIFDKDNEGNYIFNELLRPDDGKGHRESLEKIFSASALKKLDQADMDKNRAFMGAQIEAYALAYIKKTGRNAAIQINGVDRILADINVDVSNYLINAYWDYPYWIGSREVVENGTRYIYEKGWQDKGNQNGIVTFAKSIYGGDVVEKTVIEVVGSEMKCLEGTLRNAK